MTAQLSAPRLPLLGRLLPIAAMLCARVALASPEYTDTLQRELGIECPPRCTLCHRDAEGGIGTIRPASLGEALVSVGGLEAEDPAGLRCALRLATSQLGWREQSRTCAQRSARMRVPP